MKPHEGLRNVCMGCLSRTEGLSAIILGRSLLILCPFCASEVENLLKLVMSEASDEGSLGKVFDERKAVEVKKGGRVRGVSEETVGGRDPKREPGNQLELRDTCKARIFILFYK